MKYIKQYKKIDSEYVFTVYTKMYCIKHNSSNTFLSTQGNRTKPAILAFTKKQNARNIQTIHRQFTNIGSLQTTTTIVSINTKMLIDICTNVHLDIVVIDLEEEIVDIALNPNENYINMLNRSFYKNENIV